MKSSTAMLLSALVGCAMDTNHQEPKAINPTSDVQTDEQASQVELVVEASTLVLRNEAGVSLSFAFDAPTDGAIVEVDIQSAHSGSHRTQLALHETDSGDCEVVAGERFEAPSEAIKAELGHLVLAASELPPSQMGRSYASAGYEGIHPCEHAAIGYISSLALTLLVSGPVSVAALTVSLGYLAASVAVCHVELRKLNENMM